MVKLTRYGQARKLFGMLQARHDELICECDGYSRMNEELITEAEEAPWYEQGQLLKEHKRNMVAWGDAVNRMKSIGRVQEELIRIMTVEFEGMEMVQ